ncbi:GNAT family N-acetyltransferase [bacterium]|nr:GNAT family N-acetyltransferase [bacterium]MBU1676669.1 GNAT family N-acetyltransferase [bacterium]
MDFVIKTFEQRYVEDVAKLHCMALPRGFLSTLGTGFLGRLYLGIADADLSGVWVAVGYGDRCLGFISGSRDLHQCYRYVLRHGWFPLGIRLAGSLFRWRSIVHLSQTLAYPFRKLGADGDEKDEVIRLGREVRAELLSIAVASEARGMGVGRALVEMLEQYLLDCGHSGLYRVVTDAEDPRSNAFYDSVGFSLRGQFRHHEHTMALYTKAVGPGCGAMPNGQENCL